MQKNIDIKVIGLPRPFFILEYEKRTRKLVNIEKKHRTKIIKNPEITKATVKIIEIYVQKLSPLIVFLDGSPPSEEMKVCSVAAAGEYVEKDYTGIGEDFRAEIAKMADIEIVYLDEGFQKVNHNYRAQKKKIETTYLLEEMICQVKDKRAYHDYATKHYHKLFDIRNRKATCRESRKQLILDIIDTYDLIGQKECALYVEGEANFPRSHPMEVCGRKAEHVLEKEKDRLRIQSLTLELSAQTGREEFWEEKSRENIHQLPDDSRVLFIIEAGHVGLNSNRSSRKDPRVGSFANSLTKLGRLELLDFTSETLAKSLAKRWQID